MAYEVGKEAEATLVRLGFPPEEDPAFVELRAIRPTLFQSVASLLHSSDPVIREAALAVVVWLVDAPELTHHQAVLIPMVRAFLATSSNRVYRAIAVDGLDAWGEETTSLVSQAEETTHNRGEWGRDPWSVDGSAVPPSDVRPRPTVEHGQCGAGSQFSCPNGPNAAFLDRESGVLAGGA
ncbi:hypothetical protein Misp02_50700 [Microtetraspora sp. NBRC 16547]|nr:hypothetical protein Misp02_50700 [Microtetraspora sp. NBRC 16547]